MIGQHGIVRARDHRDVCSGVRRSLGHRDDAMEIFHDPFGVEQMSLGVVHDRLRDRADRCRAACTDHVESERRQRRLSSPDQLSLFYS